MSRCLSVVGNSAVLVFRHLEVRSPIFRVLSSSRSSGAKASKVTPSQAGFKILQDNALTLLLLALIPAIYWAYTDYQGWYALGAGGLPHNLFGWSVQSLLRLRASRDVRGTGCYDAAMAAGEELEKASFLKGDVPHRDGQSPETAVWVAPHRQVDQIATKEIKEVKFRTVLSPL